MDKIEMNGKTYVSARRAAEEMEYAQDYIGQLCRGGKVACERVGRGWFVDLDELKEHREEANRVIYQSHIAHKEKKEEGSEDESTPVAITIGEDREDVSKSAVMSKPTIASNIAEAERIIAGRSYISDKRASEITGISVSDLVAMAQGGKIDTRRIDRTWYMLKSDVDALKQIAGQTTAIHTAMDGIATREEQMRDSLTAERANTTNVKYINDNRPLNVVPEKNTRPKDSILSAVLSEDEYYDDAAKESGGNIKRSGYSVSYEITSKNIDISPKRIAPKRQKYTPTNTIDSSQSLMPKFLLLPAGAAAITLLFGVSFIGISSKYENTDFGAVKIASSATAAVTLAEVTAITENFQKEALVLLRKARELIGSK
ncbi:hypothetical protein COU17_01170 [Candidatus Kaiserbacteria bacterium CG10_big_fil_rev_8_21_14_0_10_49_17]|uniref:Helix-turn-helix domain-containing protein n=1 Tax=Candidatus Kaiserbacteria bacterium CG10_big_fil_rev_8_21_14_0_10_49_17 TaxID=1974609 RepID=A0A2M6WES2_9BACT|nr:MAG: hypothetical protein COU17_01170 [Candidatus Kaiserbacteria bacterium CG10_big_fil_rev_8_21_14_0_10_49_17]